MDAVFRFCRSSRYSDLGVYRCELNALKVSVLGKSHEAAQTGCEVFSTNVALGTRPGKAESRELDDQAAREAADAKLRKMNRDADSVVQHRKRQAATDVSVQ